MIDIRDVKKMVMESDDYKIIVRGDCLYVVASKLLPELELAESSTSLDYAAVLILTLRGKIFKSRYTESGSRV